MDTLDLEYDAELERRLHFIVEIDKVKHIMRQSKLFDGSRFENDAEHSWTVCVMAVLLKDFCDFEINIEKIITMLLLHDIVEIDAGDTFLYSPERNNVHEAEERAAERIFGLLEGTQKDYFINLWNEFEKRETNEAKFAAVFDRLEPLLQNYLCEGYTWKKHNVTYDMVIEKTKIIQEGSQAIWEFVLRLLERAVEKGYLKR
jgi:putative hydrolase of HD superfamily